MLVNNVGAVRIRVEGFLGTSDEEFEWAMQMDFFTGVRATRAALRPMLDQGAGSIVNVASINSFYQPDAATIDYGAAKAAVVNLSKSLAQEFGPRGIRVNCVSPGQVSTDLWLGEQGVAETVAKATGVDADRSARRPIGDRDQPVHPPRGGRHNDHDAGLRPRGEHHRCELRDRRRPDQDDLSRRTPHRGSGSTLEGKRIQRRLKVLALPTAFDAGVARNTLLLYGHRRPPQRQQQRIPVRARRQVAPRPSPATWSSVQARTLRIANRSVRPPLGSANSRSSSCRQVSSHGGVYTSTSA